METEDEEDEWQVMSGTNNVPDRQEAPAFPSRMEVGHANPRSEEMSCVGGVAQSYCTYCTCFYRVKRI
jgi:hypothetical protein